MTGSRWFATGSSWFVTGSSWFVSSSSWFETSFSWFETGSNWFVTGSSYMLNYRIMLKIVYYEAEVYIRFTCHINESNILRRVIHNVSMLTCILRHDAVKFLLNKSCILLFTKLKLTHSN